MAEPTFEYCSLRYLNQWLSHDQHYSANLAPGQSKDTKLNGLRKAASYYGIARNFPLEHEQGSPRFSPVLNVIDHMKPSDFDGDCVKEILDITSKLEDIYKKNVLSATTKFLWLKLPKPENPILIYDSLARSALEMKRRDLREYHEKWRSEFESNLDQIREACAKLPDVYEYAVSEISVDEIKTLTSQGWFQERVFDIFLWYKGSR